jgi:tetratricopeptide (TPR) repeat protein
MTLDRAWRWALGALVAAAALAVFSPAVDNGFVSYDDGIYITQNLAIRGLGSANLRWMLTNPVGGLWQPLTLLSLAVDYALWGLEPWGFHLTNVALHAAAGVLFYLVCLRLFKLARPDLGSRHACAAAALGALFFVVHPMRVESVAWAVERKDVLSGSLALAALLCRLRAAEARKWSWEAAGLAAYALSLSAKAAAVTLPAVFLVLEIYPLRRLPLDPRRWLDRSCRQVLAPLPLYTIIAGAGLYLTVAAIVDTGVMHGLAARGAAWRAGQVLYGVWYYPAKTLWPAGLAAFHGPRPWFGHWSGELIWRAAVLLAGVVVLARAGRRRPWLGAAVACYAVLFFTKSGVMQAGMLCSVGDRFSYLSCLSLAALFGAAGIGAGAAGRALAAAWLLALGLDSSLLCADWRDTVTLWSAAVARAPSGFASSNLGVALVEAGRVKEGVARLERTVAEYPGYALGFDNLGVAMQRLGDVKKARELWRRGLAVERTADLHAHLGAALASGDRAELAQGVLHLRTAVTLNARYAPWRLELADALARLGRGEEAEAQYAQTAALDPGLGKAQNNWGLLLQRQGRREAAAGRYRLALRSDDARAEANYNWGNLLLDLGRLDEAERHFREALRIDPGLARAQVNLGNILARRGRWAEAAARYRLALQKDPGLREARVNLAAVARARGR